MNRSSKQAAFDLPQSADMRQAGPHLSPELRQRTADPHLATKTSLATAGAFWSALHHRITDQITLAPIRGWLHANAHLEPSERAGWPVLVLVLDAQPPAGPLGDTYLILRRYRGALAASAGKSGPLADLARSVELREVES